MKNVKFYDGTTLKNLNLRVLEAYKLYESEEALVTIEEYDEVNLDQYVSDRLIYFKYKILDTDISKDELYLDDQVSYHDLFCFVRNNLHSSERDFLSVDDFVQDATRQSLQLYVQNQRKQGNH